jgi:hypothetical protein
MASERRSAKSLIALMDGYPPPPPEKAQPRRAWFVVLLHRLRDADPAAYGDLVLLHDGPVEWQADIRAALPKVRPAA